MDERVQIAKLIDEDGTEHVVNVEFLSPVDLVKRKNKIYSFAGHVSGVFVYEEVEPTVVG